MSTPIRDLSCDFVVLCPDQAATAMPASPSLYEELDTRFNGFTDHWLVAVHGFNADWPSWEIHPAGDEIVVLLSGEVTLVLKNDGGDQFIALNIPGSYVIVPRDTWHTARIDAPSRMLFITPGESTENRVL